MNSRWMTPLISNRSELFSNSMFSCKLFRTWNDERFPFSWLLFWFGIISLMKNNFDHFGEISSYLDTSFLLPAFSMLVQKNIGLYSKVTRISFVERQLFVGNFMDAEMNFIGTFIGWENEGSSERSLFLMVISLFLRYKNITFSCIFSKPFWMDNFQLD